MSEKFEHLLLDFEVIVSADDCPEYPKEQREIDARAALVEYVTGLEAEVERLREELDEIGKARHKDVLVLGGLYLKNQELTTRNLALVEDNFALRMEIDKLREAARWIPVSERLPEPGRFVNVVMSGMVASLALSCDGTSWQNNVGWPYHLSSVTYWMPLPEPSEVE